MKSSKQQHTATEEAPSNTTGSTTPAPDGSSSASTTTRTPLQQQADEVLAAMASLRSKIPDFAYPHPHTRATVTSKLSVSDDFIRSALAAAEAQPDLVRGMTIDVDEARAEMDEVQVFREVAAQALFLAKGVRYSIDRKKAKWVDATRRIYGVGKVMERDTGNPVVAEHVAIMRRQLGLTGHKKKQQNGGDQSPPSGGASTA